MTNSKEDLVNILDQVTHCSRCNNLEPWTKFSKYTHGNTNSRCMLISIAPGESSISNNKMWTGHSGSIIRKVVQDIGTDLEELLYMTDVVKCLPLGNRKPSIREFTSCVSYLKEEIRIIKPKYILVFGGDPLKYILKHFKAIVPIPVVKITRLHNPNGFQKIWFNEFTLIPLVHPANANILFRDDYTVYLKHLKEVFQMLLLEGTK
jgi:uracil-DNA glycosylase family 4